MPHIAVLTSTVQVLGHGLWAAKRAATPTNALSHINFCMA
jgi:hypothetical protein